MAATKGLNPDARAYIPLSYKVSNHQPPHTTERGERRRDPARAGGCFRSGKREFWRPQGEVNWSPRFGRQRVFPRKHEVLPLSRSEESTTVMIKNVPKDYNRDLLLKFLDEHCKSENGRVRTDGDGNEAESAFDFLYLPMDFTSGGCRGFAFVNFTDPRAVWKFHTAWEGKRCMSPKQICRIARAVIQGKEALVKHFEKSIFCCRSDDLLPVCFSPPRDGSGEPVKQTAVGRRVWRR